MSADGRDHWRTGLGATEHTVWLVWGRPGSRLLSAASVSFGPKAQLITTRMLATAWKRTS
jgi:hypothetical protein